MDEMMHKGTPWLDKPLSETYRAYECSFNDTSLCAYQERYWVFWYEADHRYALPTVAFFLTAIVLSSLAHIINAVAPQSFRQSRTIQRIIALNRVLSYRTYRIDAMNWSSAPLGILLLGVIGAIYFFCMTLVPKPYYWPDIEGFGSSPPIATRSGWLSLGCMPFVFATAGKSNFITLVTGVSHEKLQVFHRWISYAFFVTALVHTFPFIVHNIQAGTMVASWNTQVFYWTGVVALLAQGWLTFASMGPLRTLHYEFFKFTHFLAALIFTLFLFFHCDHTLSSWDYFIATGILFSFSWLHRQIKLYFEHGVHHRANIHLLSNGYVCVRIPTTSTWAIGQHFFVRFMGLGGGHIFGNHPFTACSLPGSGAGLAGSKTTTAKSELVFYIRPRGGMTTRLAHYASQHPNNPMRVLLDGPYGGIAMQKVVHYRHQLVIAGGSAAGWVLPLLGAFLLRQPVVIDEKPVHAPEGEGQEPLRMRIILATRDHATLVWFEEAVRDLLAEYGMEKTPPGLTVEVYYTGSSSPSSLSNIVMEDGKAYSNTPPPLLEKTPTTRGISISRSDSSSSSTSASPHEIQPIPQPSFSPSSSPLRHSTTHQDRRPHLPSLIKSEVSQSSTRLGVFVCGPLSMQHDVANAVAEQQMKIVNVGGKGMGKQEKEVYLHVDHFQWA